MIDRLEISDIAKETMDVLNYFDSNFVSKIPYKFLNGLKKLAKKSTMSVKIDKNKKLKEQNISEESKDLISLIYYHYIATEEEKEKLIKIWNQNESLYQKKLSERYSLDNIWKRNDKKEIEEEKLDLPIVITKENFLRKIITFVKKIFNKS